MKRVKVTALVKDNLVKANWKGVAEMWGGELESYEESTIAKDKDILQEYSFESMSEAAFGFAKGIWMAAKGFSKMTLWSVVTIISGLKWLWKRGAGAKKEKKEAKK